MHLFDRKQYGFAINRINIRKLYLSLYSVLLCFLCVGSSPLLNYMDPDSQNFRLLGRAMQRGQIAYVDIFDHKGPYLYFIEYIGALISPHSEWGLFLVELICYVINALLVYSIVHMAINNEKVSVFSSAAFMGVFFNFFTFVTGNLTDSYSVTFQLISIYFLAKYFLVRKSVEHPPLYMFIHAIMACCCALMRSVNAGMWIGFGIILAIRLLSQKKYLNFAYNFVALICGVLAGFIPAIWYGLKNKCLVDMWYGTVVVNMSYVSNASGAHRFVDFLKHFVLHPSFLVVLLAIMGLLVLYYDRRIGRWFKATAIAMFVTDIVFMNVSLRNDGQYNELLVVFTIPVAAFVMNYIVGKINKCVIAIALLCITLLGNIQLIKQFTGYGVYRYHYKAACEMKQIMDDYKLDNSKVLVTGTQSLYYNVTDTIPHIKYFIIYGYGLHYEVFPDATLMQADSVCSGENDYVIANYFGEDYIWGVQEIDNRVKDYLADNYISVYSAKEGIHTEMYVRKELYQE